MYFSRKVLLHVSTSNIYLQESRKAERAHDYVEYSDNTFLEKLGITLPNRKLKDFWPPGGPKWDALRALCTNYRSYLIRLRARASLSTIYYVKHCFLVFIE